ncbi:hypothetical protein GCM10011390_11560 [Aureimonas endophytica]|uniref:Antitoxin ParD1/3/4 n=1 Tax=Aureimonas endophytica TaxID=2027858 RepID=A0A917E1B8_9HYPH|nr:type II toxin-antitoxin system ParD family antitoxin [Aureimonas endophytica]GGD94487.1 hypothetical protein GCM10011390_11560 [Aureimonas endophytica]
MTEEPKTLTVDLGDQQNALDELMATGRYASPSEVVQEALQALEREDALIEELMEDKLQGVLDEAPAPADATEPARG